MNNPVPMIPYQQESTEVQHTGVSDTILVASFVLTGLYASDRPDYVPNIKDRATLALDQAEELITQHEQRLASESR